MTKRLAAVVVVMLMAGGLSLVAAGKKGTWTGWVTDSICGAKGANASHAECARTCVLQRGAKYALYDESSQKVYILNPQTQAAQHVAQRVVVNGMLDGDTITAATFSKAK